MSRDVDPASAEPVAYLISRGWAADFLTRLAFPVIAFPPRHLYRVVVHGHGFEMPVDQSDPITSFLVTFYVAARTADDAATRAMQRVHDRWVTFYPEATGKLVVAVNQVERPKERFTHRSRSGFSFYGEDDDIQAS